MQYYVASPEDCDSIHEFAFQKLAKEAQDEVQFRFDSWTASWRKESLEYYLKTGWSFVAKEDNQVRGFFLAQPQLFVNQQTQSIWVEFMLADSSPIYDFLFEIILKTAREKHIQRVLFAQPSNYAAYLDKTPIQLMSTELGVWDYNQAKYKK